MGAVFHPAVLTGVRRILNLVGEQAIPCLAAGPTTGHTASPAAEATTRNQSRPVN